MRLSNVAAAYFSFQSILLSKYLFVENPMECPLENSEQKKKRAKISSRKYRKTQCSRKR
jgi:hypothetical protein